MHPFDYLLYLRGSVFSTSVNHRGALRIHGEKRVIRKILGMDASLRGEKLIPTLEQYLD